MSLITLSPRQRVTKSVVRVLKTVVRVEAVIRYCLSSDNGKATEKQIPVNPGFLFSADKLWRPICEISALPAVAPGPSWRMPGLAGAAHQPCLLRGSCVGADATSPCWLLLRPGQRWRLPPGFVCLKSCRRFSVLISVARCPSGAGEENKLVLSIDCGSCGLFPAMIFRLLFR